MIRHISLQLALALSFAHLYGQIHIDNYALDKFENQLFLHKVSDEELITDNLLQDLISNQELDIAQKLIEYPYSDKNNSTDHHLSPQPNLSLELIKMDIKSKNYEQAKSLLQKINSTDLTKEEKVDYSFYKGYLKFIHKEFKEALSIFDSSESIKNNYKYESTYYSAFCNLFLNDYESAHESFSLVQGQKKYKNDIPYYLALCKYQLEEYNEVISTLQSELKGTKSIYKDEMKELLNRAYYKESKWNELSQELLSQQSKSESPEEHYFAGMALYKKGNLTEALDHLTHATKLKSEEAQNALIAIGSIYSQKDPNLAIPMYQEAASMSYNDNLRDQSLLLLAQTYQKVKNWTALNSTLERINESSSTYPNAQTIKYKSLYQQGKYEEALQVLAKNPEIKDQSIYQELAYRSGLKAIKSRDFEKADKLLNIAREVDSNPYFNQKSNYLLAKIYFETKNYEQLEIACNQYISNHSSNLIEEIEMHYFLALSSDRNKKYNAAISSYNDTEKSIAKAFGVKANEKLEIIYEDVLIRKADCYYKLGKKKKALLAYESAYDYVVKRGDYTLYQRGKLEDLLGEPFHQIATYETLEINYPESKYLMDALLKKGQALLALDKSKDAFDQFKKVYLANQSSEPQKLKALLQLGLVTYNQGDLDLALGYYKKAISKSNIESPESKHALLAIEEIYLKDLKDSDSYFAYVQSLPVDGPMNIDKDSIDFSIAMNLIKTDQTKGLTALNYYLSKYPNGISRVNAHKEAAKIHEANGDALKAVESYSQLMAESPKLSQLALQRIIHNLSKTDNYTEYIKYNEVVIQSNFSEEMNTRAYANIARASTKLDEISPYSKRISMAISQDVLSNDEKGQIVLILAKEYYRDKKYKDLKEQISYLVKSDNNTIAAEGYLLLTQRLMETRNLSEALSTSKTALQKNPSNKNFISRVILAQADIFIRQSNYDAAESALNSLVSQSDISPMILKEADSLLKEVKSKRKAQLEANNPTISLQYGTHE